MIIEYFKKNVYGNEKMYIKDSKIAKYIYGLTSKKTLDANTMDILTKLFDVKFDQVIE